MGKLVVFAAAAAIMMVVAAGLLALAEASRFTVTTTVDGVEEEYYGRQSDDQNPVVIKLRCIEQVQQQMRGLRPCMEYLSSRLQPQQEAEDLRGCCNTLQNINERCRCESVKQALMLQEQRLGEQMQEDMQEQMRMKATDLPRKCKMAPQECDV